jgi:hypothetical protein
MMSYDVGGVTGYGQNIDRPNMKQGEITEAAQVHPPLPLMVCTLTSGVPDRSARVLLPRQ